MASLLDNCLVSEPLINPVELIDTFSTSTSRDDQGQGQNSTPVRQLTVAGKSSLAAYLDNAANKNYTCRYMFVALSSLLPFFLTRFYDRLCWREGMFLTCMIDRSASEIHGNLCKSQKICWTS
jgi:hypothetical protein